MKRNPGPLKPPSKLAQRIYKMTERELAAHSATSKPGAVMARRRLDRILTQQSHDAMIAGPWAPKSKREVVRQIRGMGMRVKWLSDDQEWRVAMPDNNEDSAYYTPDAEDAISTARRMKRRNTSPGRKRRARKNAPLRNLKLQWWFAPIAAVVAGAGVFFATRKAKAAPPIPAGPLRPPPVPADAPAPGPAARRLQSFIDGLSDTQVAALRAAMPSHWWGFMAAAVQMPDDGGVTFVFGPARIDYSVMTEQQRDSLEDGIIDAVGYWNALELKSILVEVGVIG